MEDWMIVRLLFQRSEEAVAELDRKYGKICSAIAYRILQNREDAEECVNDAFLAVWNTVPPEKPEPLLAYVCRIVRNLSLKKYHYNTAEKRNSHYHVVLVRELAEEVNAFLRTLKKRERAEYSVWGCFQSGSQLVKGSWKVAFFLNP